MFAAPSKISGAADWLMLALIMSLVAMKPAVVGPIMIPDLVFGLLAAAVGIELLAGRRALRDFPCILLLYPLSLVPSLLATPALGTSLLKLTTTGYLVALAGVTAMMLRTEQSLRRAVLAWLGATVVVAGVALISLAAFLWDPDSPLLELSRSHFGTLPPGAYPRLNLTFANANMLANYLTVSLGLLLIASERRWLSPALAAILLAGIGIAAVPTLSPGLGGLFLASGLWLWLTCRERSPAVAWLGVAAGSAAAFAFVVVVVVTPFFHPTAPGRFALPGIPIELAPSGRLQTWTAALDHVARHPWIGHGIGVEPVLAIYRDPAGAIQSLSDAHNVVLSIATQAGLIGVLGLALIVGYALRLSLPWRLAPDRTNLVPTALGMLFVNVLLYQGIGGSFEDTRHIWVLLGILIAAARLERRTNAFTPAGENSRTIAAPSPSKFPVRVRDRRAPRP